MRRKRPSISLTSQQSTNSKSLGQSWRHSRSRSVPVQVSRRSEFEASLRPPPETFRMEVEQSTSHATAIHATQQDCNYVTHRQLHPARIIEHSPPVPQVSRRNSIPVQSCA